MDSLDADGQMRIETALDNISMLAISLAEAMRSMNVGLLEARVATDRLLAKTGVELDQIVQRIHPLALRAHEAANAIEQSTKATIEATKNLDLLVDAAANVDSPIVDLASTITETSSSAEENLRQFIVEWIDTQRSALDEQVLQVGTELRNRLAEPVVEAIEDLFTDMSEAVVSGVGEVLQPIADSIAASVEELLNDLVDRLAGGDRETRQENLALQPVLDT